MPPPRAGIVESGYESWHEIRHVQREPSRTWVEYVCILCGKPLASEAVEGYAHCYRCLAQVFSPKPKHEPLVIRINGRSTVDDFLELEFWQDVERRRNGAHTRSDWAKRRMSPPRDSRFL